MSIESWDSREPDRPVTVRLSRDDLRRLTTIRTYLSEVVQPGRLHSASECIRAALAHYASYCARKTKEYKDVQEDEASE